MAAARLRGQGYLLRRHLFRRLSPGEAIAKDRKGGWDWRCFAFPAWWHYAVLRALDYFRSAGLPYDPRLAEALALVQAKADQNGRWPREVVYPGVMPVETDAAEGLPSRHVPKASSSADGRNHREE